MTQLHHNPNSGSGKPPRKVDPPRGLYRVPLTLTSFPPAKGQMSFKLAEDGNLSFYKSPEYMSTPLFLELENIPGGKALKTSLI